MLNEGITPAVDEVLHLVRVLTKSGEALRNGYIEIWQTGTNGSYVHSGERNTGGTIPIFKAHRRMHYRARRGKK